MEPHLPPAPHADRQLLELHALRQRQLRTAFLHGRRRTWRERRRIWPAVVVALVLIALVIAGASVVDAFHRQQALNAAAARPGSGFVPAELYGDQARKDPPERLFAEANR
jgi:peptidoglycan/LPS O-acetylase OafA/YrhL